MKEISKSFDFAALESALYKNWEDSGAFKPSSSIEKEPYTLMMPPPNATGTLHLGHATMLAIEDILVRFKRMQGYSTLYVPGTDHAAIATQSVVEKKLQNEGIRYPRQELGREKLLEKIREFVADSQSTIKNQIRRMGTSCDWDHEAYTFSEDLNHAVNTLFKMMFEDGLIYRGDRIVNWDPKMQTTVADDELEYEEKKESFYTFQYGPFQISTARPETKFGDKYVVMHPNDERYKQYKHGDTFECEWINGPITATIIKDEAVDPEFGTGVMTITPWHDAVDFDMAERHHLEKEQVIDLNGKLLPMAGDFAGMSIEAARPKIVERLAEKGLVVKTDENYVHNVAVNYRGKGKVEPQILKQWFVDVNKPAVEWKGKKLSLKEVMADTVRSGMIKIYPERFEKTYFHWIDHLRDWCISRQIWWGHRIPVWYKDGETVCSETSPGPDWVQDEDTLDTWFSSQLWTFSTLGWPEKTPDLMRFTPSNVLETGYDILFFWVARMILGTTYALRKTGFPEEKSIPFRDVYLHGLIRDIHGKKMSKSRPETCIDPLEMIEKYGTDAVRLSLVVGSTPGNDMRLYEEKIAGFRNFGTKIWNGARFVMMNLDDSATEIHLDDLTRADKWILTRLNEIIEGVTQALENYQLSEAGMLVYDFFWGEFCDWYLEMSKVHKNSAVLSHVLKTSLKLLHPFIPFVTEALWQELGEEEMLISAPWPKANPDWNFPGEKTDLDLLREVIAAIRSLRTEAKVDATKKIHAIIHAHESLALLEGNKEVILRMANLSQLDLLETAAKPDQSLSAFVKNVEIYLPLKDLIDPEVEQKRVAQELAQLEDYRAKLIAKLENKEFVGKAPGAVIEAERAKLADVERKMEKLRGAA